MFRWIFIAAAFATFGLPALAADCADWNTSGFFKAASVNEVVACLGTGADVNARDELGSSPLQLAAMQNENPAVIEALIAAGAEITARNSDGKLPFDYAEENKAIKGTKVYWKLNEGRFK